VDHAQLVQGYTYRISIQCRVFLIAGALAVLIALIIISFLSNKAARANPANSLRLE
jgi:putative ABC transport system permease protein